MSTMIALIGEQPMPNLLPVLYYQPERVVLVYTEKTEKVAQRLKAIRNEAILLGPVGAYDITDTEECIRSWIETNAIDRTNILFNVTGGTKMMMLPSYRLAEKMGSPFFYLESGKINTIYLYRFLPDGTLSLSEKTELPPLIDIETFLRVHVGGYSPGSGAKEEKGRLFEEGVYHSLEGKMDEIKSNIRIGGALEIDLVVRIGNRFGIIEAKAGRADKKAIDQLNTAGGREYLGTYTSKFVVMGESWGEKSNLRELAEARQIAAIEMSHYDGSGTLVAEDQQRLVETIRERM
ncbi:MAG: DUF1887 family protein [Chloroflexaceae bacterium]|nr:DUF1887 family protein [Chloroflexaceae bacterium]